MRDFIRKISNFYFLNNKYNYVSTYTQIKLKHIQNIKHKKIIIKPHIFQSNKTIYKADKLHTQNYERHLHY